VKFTALGLVAGLFLFGAASAQDFGGFGDGLVTEPINPPAAFGRIDDPTGSAVTPKVFSFTIAPGACATATHANGDTDCTFKSIRSQIHQAGAMTQPEEAWYQWQMYLPADFPVGTDQKAGGLYNFAYFHNTECPHLNLTSETRDNPRLFLQINQLRGACYPEKRIDLGDISAMRGRWLRFELSVRWSKEDDGWAKLFIDGERVADYVGHTRTKDGPDRVFFKAGIYLCCTSGTEKVSEATNYFTGLQRATSSAALYSDAEQEVARQLQAALNALGCDVGTPDGIAGPKTRLAAQTCRQADNGSLPPELVASNVERFLAFYTSPGIEDRAAGTPATVAQ